MFWTNRAPEMPFKVNAPSGWRIRLIYSTAYVLAMYQEDCVIIWPLKAKHGTGAIVQHFVKGAQVLCDCLRENNASYGRKAAGSQAGLTGFDQAISGPNRDSPILYKIPVPTNAWCSSELQPPQLFHEHFLLLHTTIDRRQNYYQSLDGIEAISHRFPVCLLPCCDRRL